MMVNVETARDLLSGWGVTMRDWTAEDISVLDAYAEIGILYKEGDSYFLNFPSGRPCNPEPLRECEVETDDGQKHRIMLYRDGVRWCNRADNGDLFEYALSSPVKRWRYITELSGRRK